MDLRHAVLLSFALFLGFDLHHCRGQKQPPSTEVVVGPKGEKIKTLVVNASESLGFSGTVLVADKGKVITACGVGFADLENRQPLESTTLFEIASASKPFTAVAVCKLVESGKLKLDDSISDHLPGVPESCKAITVRHLLQHTSGIPGTNSQGRGDDLAAVLPLFLKGGPTSKPGTHWEYWNQGYALLTEIIARASGKSFVEFCRSEIFAAAKMKSTCFTGDRKPKAATVAVGRSKTGAPRSAFEHPYGSFGFEYRGMGGVVTNLPDLWKFDRALRRNRLLSAENQEVMFTPGLEDYALGWRVGNRDGHAYQSHSGSVRGFLSDLRRYPDDNASIFLLCNDDASTTYPIMKSLERLLFDNPKFAMIPKAIPEEQQERLVGTYVSEKNHPLIVEAIGEVTKGRIEWGFAVTHGHLGMNENQKLVFFDGNLSELKLEPEYSGPVQTIHFGKSVYRRR